MKISIHIEGSADEAELQAVLAVLAGGMAFQPGEPVVEGKANKPKATRSATTATAETPEASASSVSTTSKPSAAKAEPKVVVDAGTGQSVIVEPEEQDAQTAATGDVPTREEVKTAATLLTQKGAAGNAALKGLFEKYGVEKFSQTADFDDSKTISFYADLQEAIAD